MKLIVIFILSLLAISAFAGKTEHPPMYQPADNGAKEAIQIIGGFIVGAFGRFTSIETCFDKTMGIFNDFNIAIRDLRDDDFIGVVNGLKDIGEALYKIPDAVKTCKEIKDIATRLKSLAVYFAHPTLLTVKAGKNIFWHAIDIYKEVKGAISSYDRRDWFGMGRNLGKIVDLVFLHAQRFKNGVASEGTDFLDGFAHGLNPTYYDDAKQCISDVSQDTIDRITYDLEDLDWKDIKHSVEDIEDLVEVFTEVVKDCKTTSEDFQKFLEDFLNAFNPATFVEAAMKIIENPLKFVRMIENIQKDVSDKDFYDAGDIIGDFVGDVFKLHVPVPMFTSS